jgi:Uma2 family endonuclease
MVTAIETLRPLTIEDLREYPDDGLRREVLVGELVVTPAPTPAHQLLVGQLVRIIGNFVDERGLGSVIPSPVDVRLTLNDVVQPDVVFVSLERAGMLTGGFIDGVPDLVIEVLSPSTRRTDLVRKMALYATVGIKEYWIVDPEKQSIVVHRNEDRKFCATPSVDGFVKSLVLPGLEIGSEQIFAKVRS